MSIVVAHNNIAMVAAASDDAIEKALEAIGMQAENYARVNCPVDTGRLKNSLTHQVDTGKKMVAIGTNVEYAKYVELLDRLHHNVGQAHFLRDSVTKHTKEYEEIAKTALRGW